MPVLTTRTIATTSIALLAFAGNSVLCRLALAEVQIDPASFTIIRLLSGCATLLLLMTLRGGIRQSESSGSWLAAFMLFLYAVSFSFAYVTLDTGTGALILFGSVQITMILISLITGGRLHFAEWVGVFVAFSGFLYLILPGLTTPSLAGFVLMTLAGVAWGVYTIKGGGSKNPLADTAYNFLRTLPLVLVLGIVMSRDASISQQGIVLALVSGAVTSGIGYAIWYAALAGLTATQAAVSQLLVPVIAAAGGVVFANEEISLRLVISSVLVLGGIMTVVLGRVYFLQSAHGRE